MKEKMDKILLSAMILLLVVTASPIAQALQLDTDFDEYNIHFKYPKEVTWTFKQGDELVGGTLLGRHGTHVLLVMWAAAPTDPKELAPYLSKAVNEVMTRIGLGNLSLSLGPEGQDKVQEHSVTYKLLTGKLDTLQVEGAVGAWYCDKTHRIFTLATFDVNQGFELFTEYLSNFNCHPNECQYTIDGFCIPGFPIEAIVAGLGVGFAAILLQRRRRMTAGWAGD